MNLRLLLVGVPVSCVVSLSSCSGPAESEVVMDYQGAIERYYQAYRDRDQETLRSLLTPDFRFVSSFAEYGDRDAMLDEIWPAVGQSWATNLRVFGEAPEFVVLYEHDRLPDAEYPAMSMAEYIRFEGERIAEIEVFFGRSVDPPASSRD